MKTIFFMVVVIVHSIVAIVSIPFIATILEKFWFLSIGLGISCFFYFYHVGKLPHGIVFGIVLSFAGLALTYSGILFTHFPEIRILLFALVIIGFSISGAFFIRKYSLDWSNHNERKSSF